MGIWLVSTFCLLRIIIMACVVVCFTLDSRFFLGMYRGVTRLGHVVTLRPAIEKLSDCLPKLPEGLTLHQQQVRIPVFTS